MKSLRSLAALSLLAVACGEPPEPMTEKPLTQLRSPMCDRGFEPLLSGTLVLPDAPSPLPGVKATVSFVNDERQIDGATSVVLAVAAEGLTENPLPFALCSASASDKFAARIPVLDVHVDANGDGVRGVGDYYGSEALRTNASWTGLTVTLEQR